MSLRAIWKGVLTFGEIEVPVKLYAAIEDRTVHFRLLHRDDRQPVSQKMVNPETGREVPREQRRKGLELDAARIVIIADDELEQLEPDAARTIAVSRFVPPTALTHPWYDRPYYLGPDGDRTAYWSLHAALEKLDRQGIARWTMRGKEYLGALQAEAGCLVLITLRFADQVIAAGDLRLPPFRDLEQAELKMARQLIDMMRGHFTPREYQDQYRSRVLQLIEAKKSGEKVQTRPVEAKRESESLADALAASLAGIKEKPNA